MIVVSAGAAPAAVSTHQGVWLCHGTPCIAQPSSPWDSCSWLFSASLCWVKTLEVPRARQRVCCSLFTWYLAALSQGMGKPRIPFLLWLGGPRSSGQGWSACPRGGDTIAAVHTVHFAQIIKLSTGPDAARSKTPGAATGLLVALPLTPSPSGSAVPSDAVVLSGAPPAGGCMLHSRSL